jgi:predicted nucleic acid-binding protein
MIFADLKTGESVFVDSNTLIYHFGPHPQFGPACNQLIHRIETQDILGFTSTHIIGEVAHQLMLAEASNLPGWTAGKIKRRLRKNPAVFKNLTRFRTAVDALLSSKLQILTIAPLLLGTAAAISRRRHASQWAHMYSQPRRRLRSRSRPHPLRTHVIRDREFRVPSSSPSGLAAAKIFFSTKSSTASVSASRS